MGFEPTISLNVHQSTEITESNRLEYGYVAITSRENLVLVEGLEPSSLGNRPSVLPSYTTLALFGCRGWIRTNFILSESNRLTVPGRHGCDHTSRQLFGAPGGNRTHTFPVKSRICRLKHLGRIVKKR